MLAALEERAERQTTTLARWRHYRNRWPIEAVFCRLAKFRRVATRHHKLAASLASAVALVAVVPFWCGSSPIPGVKT